MIPPNLLELIYLMNLVLFHAINPSSSSVVWSLLSHHESIFKTLFTFG